MPSLSRIRLTLAQDADQVKAHLVRVSYGYALSFEPDEVAEETSYKVSVDVLGHDLIKDDELAADLDAHVVSVAEQEVGPIDMERSFLVGQKLLDEDLGEDEIKLRIVVRSDAGEVASAETDVIKGLF